MVNPKIATAVFMRERNTRSIRVSCKANFYEVLSLGSKNGNVGFDEIKKAYRSMALQYHPDVCPPSTREESTRRFVELREAYETLSNPVSRKLHDYELGLADSLGFGGQSLEKRRSRFPKQVWENQLYRLKQRSQIRMQKKAI
ncbi:chaperone protein dnaJ 20, chloroplastic-like [Tripterygium wilfordii]|nr:chaperone protein dnaJ 20, chloroplastic-like [Tripterygium wilfordii]